MLGIGGQVLAFNQNNTYHHNNLNEININNFKSNNNVTDKTSEHQDENANFSKHNKVIDSTKDSQNDHQPFAAIARDKIDTAVKKIEEYFTDSEGKLTTKCVKDFSEEKKIQNQELNKLIPDFSNHSSADILSIYDNIPEFFNAGGENRLYKVLLNGQEIVLEITVSKDRFPSHIQAHSLGNLMAKNNISDYLPKLYGVYKGPCLEALDFWVCNKNPNVKLLYTEIEYINKVADFESLKILNECMVFEDIWNKLFMGKIGKFYIGDIKNRHFLVSEVKQDRAFYMPDGNVYLFKVQDGFRYNIHRVDLDDFSCYEEITNSFHYVHSFTSSSVKYASNKCGAKLFDFLNFTNTEFNNFDKGEENSTLKIFSLLREYFEGFIVTLNEIPENVKHYYMPKELYDILGD